ncbi:hypothetical protein [Haladaptatus sp. NG-WS-4]
MTASDAERGRDVDIDLGFTVGLGMVFEEAVEWAASEGFELVELLLDGPYARERIVDRRESMRTILIDSGVDIVVHLPFTVDAGSPFTPVREGCSRRTHGGNGPRDRPRSRNGRVSSFLGCVESRLDRRRTS